MTGTFLAAWIKLRRPPLLWGTYAATAAVVVLITALTFVFADDAGTAGAPPGPGSGTTSASLSTPSGLLQGLSSSVTFFGIIALCVTAAMFAGEYTTGTIRNMIIREPRRLRFITGTWLGGVTFTIGAVAVATLVSAGTAVAIAGSQGVDTSSWFTSDGVTTSLRTAGEVALAAVGYATLGSALGSLLRAPIPAVAIGFGWLFLIETIVAGIVDGSGRWLPGQLLSAIASNGTSDVSLAAALVTAAVYLAVAAAAAATTFIRRDITA